ncbi:MAG: hypothetical protein AAGF83_20775 [Cyanobacteria bacterium P01_G01_bin.67]
MSNNKQLKKELTNAKARYKAASKKLKKLESSEDNQAIASAQAKVDLEQEIIDDLQQRIQNDTDKVVAIIREDNGNLTNVVETQPEEFVIEDAKSLKEVISLVPLDNEPTASNKRKNDLPQVSFRTENQYYERLKQHVKHPVSDRLSEFDTLADMSRRLNLSDLNCDIHFILRRSNQQLARFLDTAQLDKSELSADDKSMLRNTFIAFNADTDADKAKLIERLESLHQFIESLNLYRFEA